MGNRGPKPQPAALLKLKGTGNITRMKEGNYAEMDLEFIYNILVDPPDTLSKIGKELWTSQLLKAHKIYGYISFIDLRLFEEYCHTYAMLQSIRKRLYKSTKGHLELKQDWVNYHKLVTRFDKLSGEFGFSPSSRTRIKIQQAPIKEEDDFKYVI